MASFCYRVMYERDDGLIGRYETFDYLSNARKVVDGTWLEKHDWVRCWIERTDGRIMGKVKHRG